MTYREQRSALRERLAVAEEKLAEAHARGEPSTELEAAAAAVRGELQRLRREQRAKKGGGRRRQMAFAGVALLVGIACAGAYAARARARGGEPEDTGPIGVAECDAYFTAVDACFVAKPGSDTAELRALLSKSTSDNRKEWKERARRPEDRPGLVLVCLAATEALEATCE